MAAAAAFLDRMLVRWDDGRGTEAGNRSAAAEDWSVLPLRIVAEFAAAVGVALAVATAWLDQDTICRAPAPVVATVCLAATYLLLAWEHRSPGARASPRPWPWQARSMPWC